MTAPAAFDFAQARAFDVAQARKAGAYTETGAPARNDGYGMKVNFARPEAPVLHGSAPLPGWVLAVTRM